MITCVRHHGEHRGHSQLGITMSRLRVESFTVSLDGFGAGPNRDITNPLGTP